MPMKYIRCLSFETGQLKWFGGWARLRQPQSVMGMLVHPTELSWIRVFQSQAAASEAAHTMSVDPQCHLQETKNTTMVRLGWQGVARLRAATMARLPCMAILSPLQGLGMGTTHPLQLWLARPWRSCLPSGHTTDTVGMASMFLRLVCITGRSGLPVAIEYEGPH